MFFNNIAYIDDQFRFHPHGYVGILGSTIDYVADEAPLDPSIYGSVYDGKNKLLMTALYNAHSHAPMTLLRGYAENLPLDRWLNEKCWPFEAKITPEDNYWAMLLACAEAARFGTVSFSDMYYATPERARAVIEAGMKANLCEGLLAFEDKPYRQYPIAAQNEAYVRELHGAADGRILIDYNIHGEYTSNPQVCRDVAEIVAEAGLRIHLHASETAKEVQECKERHAGLSPIAYFAELGVLNVPTTAAHCVWVDDDDIAILHDKGVFVALNPASNLKLGSGVAPIQSMLEAGVALCLGTDGMASNNNHNMFSDMYLMALLPKGVDQDPAIVDPDQVLYAATRGGALSQGREDCGSLKVGMRADLCVLDISGPSWTPMTNPVYNLLYAGNGADVVLTLCDGRIIYEDGSWPTIDVERAQLEVVAATRRIIESL